MRTLGIDLAADPAKTAACLVDWAEGTAVMLDAPVGDQAIVRAAATVRLAAIDVPFGWPDAFVAAVVAHHGGRGWPPVETSAPADRVPLRFRATDVDLMERGHRPLSVSTERIGVAAMRGARILELLSREGVTIDRSGITGAVAEAYPAGALRAWGLRSSGYKGSRHREICAGLVVEFAAACGTMADAVAGCLSGADDDELDAVICAFIGAAVVLGGTARPGASQLVGDRRPRDLVNRCPPGANNGSRDPRGGASLIGSSSSRCSELEPSRCWVGPLHEDEERRVGRLARLARIGGGRSRVAGGETLVVP
jgi:predicted nuclease with RNAse H fold